jgi:hypothetical protein
VFGSLGDNVLNISFWVRFDWQPESTFQRHLWNNIWQKFRHAEGARVTATTSERQEWPRIAEEPEGWRALQVRAKSERDPKKLEKIIAEMNQLLTECEQRTDSQTFSHRSQDSPKAVSVRK